VKVCYFGTYRSEYSRNRIMIEGLRLAGVEVIEVQEVLWKNIDDRIQTASGGWARVSFWVRLFSTYLHLIRRYFRTEDHDLVIVGYPGQLDVYFARILSWIRQKPLVWDIFMSIYLISIERGLDRQHSLSIILLRWLEKTATHLPDRLILDTKQYIDWFFKVHGVPSKRFRLVPTGADDRIYHPIPIIKENNELFRVVYFGTFIPNHLVETIIEAARLLKNNSSIFFELIGTGPDKLLCEILAEKYDLTNLVFIDWLPEIELVTHINMGDVVLGVFGLTPQSLMTIQNKIFSGLAMAKPIITGDSDAIRDAFTHQQHLYLIERNNPAALAEAISSLSTDPQLCSYLSEQGYQRFISNYNIKNIGEIFHAHLCEIIEN